MVDHIPTSSQDNHVMTAAKTTVRLRRRFAARDGGDVGRRPYAAHWHRSHQAYVDPATGLSLKSWQPNYERNSLLYCVSCIAEPKSTMNVADPRSSIVACLAWALVASTASSSSAMAS